MLPRLFFILVLISLTACSSYVLRSKSDGEQLKTNTSDKLCIADLKPESPRFNRAIVKEVLEKHGFEASENCSSTPSASKISIEIQKDRCEERDSLYWQNVAAFMTLTTVPIKTADCYKLSIDSENLKIPTRSYYYEWDEFFGWWGILTIWTYRAPDFQYKNWLEAALANHSDRLNE